MDETRITNKTQLRGVLCEPPQFSHESRGERFLQFSMEIFRLSGAPDKINVIVREQLLGEVDINGTAEKLTVSGELRSFNNKSGEGSKLVISVFAREVGFESGEDVNNVLLSGVICKKPNLRTTPMGREICDLMLAVNRRYGRSDYLPCIAWGIRARDVAAWSVGTLVSLEGRLQSRDYIQNVNGLPIEKTAFEVSITEIKAL